MNSTIRDAAQIMGAHAKLDTELDASSFDAAIVSCADAIQGASAEDVALLIRAFRDDVLYADVQESLRGLVERAPLASYIQGLLMVLADMRQVAPTWMSELAGIISNDLRWGEELVNASLGHDPRTRDALERTLRDAEQSGFPNAGAVRDRLRAMSADS